MSFTIEQQTTRKQKITAILTLGIPAMFENILQTMIGFIDTLFVAKISLHAVTAVSLANAILAIFMAIFMALSIGSSSLIARNIGKNDFSAAKIVAKNAVQLATIVGIIFGLITGIFAKSMLQLLGATGAVEQIGTTYLQLTGIPAVFIALTFTLGSILRASGDTTTPLKLSLYANLLHIPLGYILIFGLSMWEGLGVIGAAVATTCLRLFNTMLLYRAVQRSAVAISWRKTATSYTKPLVRLATPAAIERVIMRIGQVVYFGLILKIGANTYAAHMIAENIEAFTFMPGYGMAVVATTFVGACYGAKRFKDAYEYGMLTTFLTMGIMTTLGVLQFILCPWLATWFTNEPDVIAQIITALRIDAFAQPAVAMTFVLAASLQGLGDTKTPMISTAVGMWGIRLVGVYVLGISFDLGIAGVWLALTIDLYVRGLFLWRIFHKQTRLP